MRLCKVFRRVLLLCQPPERAGSHTSAVLVDPNQVPTVAQILDQRSRGGQKNSATTRGRTPAAALYRMYEYFVAGYNNGLRSEVELFFNKPWPVSEIPDPKDPDPQRYAILAVLTCYIADAYNRLIERGLPRAAPAIIHAEMEAELRARPKVLEVAPAWAAGVPKLDEVLILPDLRELHPAEDRICIRLRALNIISEPPYILFV